jgi:hypothetical protein
MEESYRYRFSSWGAVWSWGVTETNKILSWLVLLRKDRGPGTESGIIRLVEFLGQVEIWEHFILVKKNCRF